MEYLTLQELSEYLKKPKMWCYTHANLLGVKVGRRWSFSKEWADRYMEEQRMKQRGWWIQKRQAEIEEQRKKDRSFTMTIRKPKKPINIKSDQVRKTILENPRYFPRQFKELMKQEKDKQSGNSNSGPGQCP